MAGKRIFVSYAHEQTDWVRGTLVPCLRAGGAEVLVDYLVFNAGRTVVGQMDATQDRADVHLLVMSESYLASKYCRHEMSRAIKTDPDFREGRVLPVKREKCTLPARLKGLKQPLYVTLTDDKDASQWNLLMRFCETDLGVPVPEWLRVRDEICLYLSRDQSVNLVVPERGIRWRKLIDHVRDDFCPRLGQVDLQSGSTAPRRGFVEELLRAADLPTVVAKGTDGEDLLTLARSFEVLTGKAKVAILHFDVVTHRPEYDWNFFAALRDLISEQRKLVLLIHSRTPFAQLLPEDNPLSSIGSSIKLVELRRHP